MKAAVAGLALWIAVVAVGGARQGPQTRRFRSGVDVVELDVRTVDDHDVVKFHAAETLAAAQFSPPRRSIRRAVKSPITPSPDYQIAVRL